jgi:PhnB protein
MIMSKATPFLLFDGNCAEAMTFYHECIGGELTLVKLSETPMKEMFPVEKHGRIINAYLKNGDIEISATDWMASPDFNPVVGNTSAIFITADSLEELQPMFDKLKDGKNNHHLQELHKMPFGSYGQFFDKFETQWIFRSTN